MAKMYPILGILSVVGALIAATAVVMPNGDYRVTVVMPEGNPKLAEGAHVHMKGFEVGEISSIEPQNNKALVEVALADNVAPLHAGATVHLEWKALVGERMLSVKDGPKGNAEIPDGGLIQGDNPVPMEMSEVLAALDQPTRRHLGSLIHRLEATLDGHESDLQRSLRTTGPALASLGEVLRGIGSDGAAISSLVTNLNNLMRQIESRSGETQAVVSELSQTANAVADKRGKLQQALTKLPRTLDITESVLGDIPDTTNEAVPLLNDLAVATEPLPSTATNLSRLLREVRPMVADLKPTLESASVLLDHTPALLDSTHSTLPKINDAARAYMPALEFLRPYTPEAVGWLTTWGNAAQSYDANGRYMRAHVQGSSTSVNANPGVAGPGITQDTAPRPGAPGGISQDAAGEGMN